MSYRFIANKKNTTLMKLESFAELPEGWHYGRGGPISKETLLLAKELHAQIIQLALSPTDAFPGADGEVQLTAYPKNHFISLTIEPTGEISLCHELDGVEQRTIEAAQRKDIIKALHEISGSIWSISASSTPGTLTTSDSGSARLHLSSPQSTKPPRWLTQVAW